MPTTTRAATQAVIRLDKAVSMVKAEPKLTFSEIVIKIIEDEGHNAKAASIEQNLTYPFGFRGPGARNSTLEVVGKLARGERSKLDEGFIERLRSHGRHRPAIVSRLLGDASPRYWLAAAKDKSKAPRMMRLGIWDKLDWRRDDDSAKAKIMWRRFQDISIGDWVAVKTGNANKAPDPNIWIHFIGRVTSKDEEAGTLHLEVHEHEWEGRHVGGRGSGNHTETLAEVTIKEVIAAYFDENAPLFQGTGSESLRQAQAIREVLTLSRNIVLEGVPGTGKTYFLNQMAEAAEERDEPLRDGAEAMVGASSGRHAITLHPATSYEDFVEGLRPGVPNMDRRLHDPRAADQEPLAAIQIKGATELSEAGQRWFWEPVAPVEGQAFSMHDGFFVRVCSMAIRYPRVDFVVLLDEINRCNVPKVLGDLLTTLERSKRAQWNEPGEGEEEGSWDLKKTQPVRLSYSGRLFFVPENIFVVATMNTTDRSVAPLDAALRRRFAFLRLWPLGFVPGRAAPPAEELAEQIWDDVGRSAEPHPLFVRSVGAWLAINEALKKLGPDAMLGHSYLFDLAEDITMDEEAERIVRHHWNHHLLPQLVDVLVSNHKQDALEDNKQGGASTAITRALGSNMDPLRFEHGTDGQGLLRVPRVRLIAAGDAS